MANCGKRGLSWTFIERHMVRKHGHFQPELVGLIQTNRQIEAWCEMVLYYQTRLMAAEPEAVAAAAASASASEPAPEADANKSEAESELDVVGMSSEDEFKSAVVPEKQPQTNGMFKCDYCGYASWLKTDVLKHEKRHWAYRAVKCGYCNFEG